MTDPTPEPVWAGPPPEPAPPPSGPLPPAPTDPRPWGMLATTGWTILLFATMIVTSVPMVAVYRLIAPRLGKSVDLAALQQDGDFFWLNSFSSLLVAAVVLAVALALRPAVPARQYLALRPAAVRWYFIFFGALLVYGMAAEFALRYLGVSSMPEWMTTVAGNTRSRAGFFLAIVAGAPLLEEVVFRGFVFTGFRPRAGAAGAIFAGALPWALLHVQYELIYIPVALGMGLIFGYAREKSGSLFVPLALHALNNTMAYAQMMYFS